MPAFVLCVGSPSGGTHWCPTWNGHLRLVVTYPHDIRGDVDTRGGAVTSLLPWLQMCSSSPALQLWAGPCRPLSLAAHLMLNWRDSARRRGLLFLVSVMLHSLLLTAVRGQPRRVPTARGRPSTGRGAQCPTPRDPATGLGLPALCRVSSCLPGDCPRWLQRPSTSVRHPGGLQQELNPSLGEGMPFRSIFLPWAFPLNPRIFLKALFKHYCLSRSDSSLY